MARDHARFQTAIHSDPDFRKLDQGAQHVGSREGHPDTLSQGPRRPDPRPPPGPAGRARPRYAAAMPTGQDTPVPPRPQ